VIRVALAHDQQLVRAGFAALLDAVTKLGVRDRAQLVVFAYPAGLVRPGWAD
jgi:hypothetical protein